MTSPPRQRSTVCLVLATLFAGLACAAFAAAVNWFDAWWIGDISARAPVEDLLRGAMVVIIPGGISGALWLSHHSTFLTKRGAFWSVVGAMGFVSAFVSFDRAMQVDSPAGLLAWVGVWLATVLLFGVPFGWWIGRK